jgi:hypothetical protein
MSMIRDNAPVFPTLSEQTPRTRELEDAQATEADESRKLRQIADLVDHPGWQLVKTTFEGRINQFRSGETLRKMVEAHANNDDVAAAVRIEMAVADNLAALLATVELAEQQVNEQKEARANELQGRRVREGAA